MNLWVHRQIYRLFGKEIDFSQKLQSLNVALEKANSKFTPGLLISLFLSLFLLLFLFSVLLFAFTRLFWILLAPLLSFLIFLYPYCRIYSRREKIDSELHYAFSYLSTLVSVGVTPIEAFRSLSMDETFEKELRREFELIVIDTEVFGKDLITALNKALQRTPSKKLQNILQSMVSSILAGSDLKKVLMDASAELSEEQRRSFQRKISNLSIFAEFYVIVCLFAPVLLIVFFPIVETLSNFLMFRSSIFGRHFIELFVFLLIPVISIVLLVILDLIQPKEVKI
jgi:flagellar protein FlaJ